MKPLSSLRLSSALLLLVLMSLSSGCGARAEAPVQGKSTKLPEDKDPQVLFERGKAYLAASDLVRAEQYLAAALAAGAPDDRVMPHLLRACVALRHYRLAVEYAEVALARNPQNAHLRFVVGALYVSIGDRGRAREHMEATGRDLPNDAEAQFAVAVFFRDELSDKVKADPYFREYLRIAPNGAHAEEARSSLMERVQ